MNKSKYIAFAGFCVCLAVIFQIIPALFGELFLFVTVFSTIPIYIVSRISPRFGILALVASGIMVLFVSIHEGILFFFTNGAIGMALGVGNHYFNEKSIISILGGLYLTLTLSIINYVIGIPVFGSSIPGILPLQVFIIFSFSLVYSFMYLNLLTFIFEIIDDKNILK